ncbi:MAG TPA: penicillin-binding protein 2, partial [Bacteroidetes bacterium]|nr:penicillin-binding protein 2 [Bacteroidota bacterium]
MADYSLNTRLRVLMAVSSILFAILCFRLIQLQVIHSKEYQEKSEANSLRVVEEIPGRGIICDRRGRVIVENRPSYSLSVIPFEAARNTSTIAELAPI